MAPASSSASAWVRPRPRAAGRAGDDDDAVGEAEFREAFRGAEEAGRGGVCAEVGIFLGRRLRGQAGWILGLVARGWGVLGGCGSEVAISDRGRFGPENGEFIIYMYVVAPAHRFYALARKGRHVLQKRSNDPISNEYSTLRWHTTLALGQHLHLRLTTEEHCGHCWSNHAASLRGKVASSTPKPRKWLQSQTGNLIAGHPTDD